MKKALIVSPYLDHLGGGERYMLSVASVLETFGYQIFFGWDTLAEISQLCSMLGIELRSPQLARAIKNLYHSHNPFAMLLSTRPYDLVVYLSDGSFPLLGGKKNLLHLQIPFHNVGGHNWKNQLKKKFLHGIIVNSRFTKNIVDREYGINSTVIYPPVTPISPGPKENIILSVGRFEPSLNTKHQDILIQAFRELAPQLPGWKLVLAGASTSDQWVTQLKRSAADLPIQFMINASYAELCQLYAVSRIYWHAAGYGIDETKNPELTEHFGISTVEAISAGCLPLVVPYGGQREIVPDPSLHWTTIPELIEKTLLLTTHPPAPQLDITPFSSDNFARTLQALL